MRTKALVLVAATLAVAAAVAYFVWPSGSASKALPGSVATAETPATSSDAGVAGPTPSGVDDPMRITEPRDRSTEPSVEGAEPEETDAPQTDSLSLGGPRTGAAEGTTRRAARRSFEPADDPVRGRASTVRGGGVPMGGAGASSSSGSRERRSGDNAKITPGVTGPMPALGGGGESVEPTPQEPSPVRRPDLADPGREDEGDSPSPQSTADDNSDDDASADDELPPPPARVGAFISSGDLVVGQQLVVEVRVMQATDLASAPFHIVYDPTVLAYQGGAEGPLLASDGSGTAFLAAPSGDRVVVGLSRLGQRAGVAGSGLLCTLRFTATSPGKSPLRFENARLVSATGGDLPVSFMSTAITVR